MQALVIAILVSFLPTVSWGDAHSSALALAGVEKIKDSSAQPSLHGQFQAPNSLFAVETAGLMRSFFAKHIPRASKTQNLIYLFGGPDALYPHIIFPNFRRLLLVGLEPPGNLPEVSQMPAMARLSLQGDVAKAYGNILRNSYFVTSAMAKDLAEHGTTIIIATGLVVQGFQILGIDPISLDKNGLIQLHQNSAVKGVRFRFRRPNKSLAEIYYFQFDLSDQNMMRHPELAHFIRQQQFDSAFYKAASFVSHLPNFKKINELVLNQVTLLVQADDGIPYAALAERHQAPKWTLNLYGIYTEPHSMFGVKGQPQLKALYGHEICQSGDHPARELWLKAWGTEACDEHPTELFRRVRWQGYIPFRLGYGAVTGPKILDWHQLNKLGTLMVLER